MGTTTIADAAISLTGNTTINGATVVTGNIIALSGASTTSLSGNAIKLKGTTTVDGWVGIGTTQPSSDFHVVGDTIISGTTTITIPPTNPATPLSLLIMPSYQRLGEIRIGRVDLPNFRFHSIKASNSDVSNFNYIGFDLHNGSGADTVSRVFTLFGNGNASLSGTLTSASDLRLKKNIVQLENSLENLFQLRGVNFYWKHETKSQDKQIGVIAQEVDRLYPELVSKKGAFMSVNYDGFVPIFTESIKILKKQNDALIQQISTLTKLLEALEK